MLTQVGSLALMGTRFIPHVAAIATAIYGLTKIVQHISGKSDDIANNTKKSISQELNFPLFTSEALAENKS